MNNGVNNSELTIEPIQNEQPAAQASAPTVVAQPAPVKQTQTIPIQTNDLGTNVKIAPVQPMYDESGKIIQQQNESTPAQPGPTPPPVITQPTTPPPGEPPQIQIKKTDTETTKEEIKIEETPVKAKKRINLTPFLLIIIVALIGELIYINNDKTNVINELKHQNIVINTDDQKEDLDKNSTIIQDLYSKVVTTVKEDLANQNLDDEMRRYLAFRQINTNMFYDSNCNLFDQNKIFNYTCNQKSFKPNAFKEEALQLEIKKLFGENSKIENGNIQLGRQCIGGYEYIAERGEYVEGQCIENNAVTINVKKNIVATYRINDEIFIEEETKYISGNKGDIPSTLKDGIYTYRFKLDTNLNYAYISKEFRTKY